MNRTKLAAIAIGLVAAGGLGAALAYATTNDAGSITACVEKDGTPRIVATGTACGKRESTVSWAVQGPQGPAGPKGEAGPKGDPGVSGQTLTVIGKMTLQGRNGPILGGDGSLKSIDVLSVSQSNVSPRDAASGLPTGKRMHKPFVITKQWDASSPALLQACSTNETIPEATFHFFPLGSTVESLSVKLTDASCAEITQTTDASAHELETISFTFRRIEVEHVVSKTMYADDWTTPTS
jgi:type VI secretion system secreted protein Hcp